MIKASDFNEYVGFFPPAVQKKLKQLRAVIKRSAPGAEESISYGMPAFKFYGPLVYFAGYKNHIGLYALPSAMAAFKKELSDYKTSKGTVQFSLEKELPLVLIGKMVKFRVKENREKYFLKSVKKK